MAEYDIETLNAEIAGFHEKYENIGRKLLDDNVRGEYLADADAVIEKYPNPDGEVRGQLGEFCDFLGTIIRRSNFARTRGIFISSISQRLKKLFPTSNIQLPNLYKTR